MKGLIESFFGGNYDEWSTSAFFDFFVSLLNIALIIVVTFVLARIVKAFFKRAIRRGKEKGERDETRLVFLRQLVTSVLYIAGVIGVVYQFEPLRTTLYTILAGSGVAAVIIGLASQEAVSNVISGFIITFFQPFKIGDFISIGTNMGTVETITLRHIIIRTPENRRLVVPNSLINKEVIVNSHYHDEKICNLIEFAIDNRANIDRARAILLDEILSHPHFFDNGLYDEQGNPTALIRVLRLEQNAIVLCGYAWAKTPADAFAMKCDLVESVKKRFDAAGIHQPYSNRVAIDCDENNA